jgi:hypothetical protein
MYTRVLLPQRDSPIEGGTPLQGTWTTAFKNVNFLTVEKPYKLPLPQWVLNFRIKEWQSFAVQNEHVSLTALITNMKYFCFAEIFFLDKESKEKFSVFKIFPLSAWTLAQNLSNSNTYYHSSDFSFRVHNWLDSGSVRLDIDVAPAFQRQPFTAQLEFDLDIQKSTPMSVNLLFAKNRCAYTYKGLSPVRGRIVWGNRRIALHRKSSAGLFCDNKGFYPYRSALSYCSAFGIDEKGRIFGFSLADKPTKELNKNNENALWLDGVLTPLPPVRITQTTNGDDDEWIIQDVEGMIDLTFKPLEFFENTFEIVLARFEHKTPAGQFSGTLLDKDGEKLKLRNFWGFAERIRFRI